MSVIVAIDGLPGAGKTTAIKALSRRFRTMGISFKRNSIGDAILVKELRREAKRYPVNSLERTCIFFQLRMSQFFVAEITSKTSDIVVMDRFLGSSFAFNVDDNQTVQRILEMGKRIVLPKIDLILFFDIPYSVACLRKISVTTKDVDFARKLEQKYRQVAKEWGWVTIDATQPSEKVADDCFRLIVDKYNRV